MGSVNVVTNAAGNVVESHSFDAWGRRRSTTDFSYLTAFNSAGLLGSRGYTFHEHLDQFGLINMNGRLYDPQLGRMLSPDPVVITNASLNFNAYSYVNNNPLKYTDPSGEVIPAILAAVLIGAAIGGVGNVVGAAMSGRIKNFGDFLFYAGTGALVGAGAAAGGIALAPVIGSGAIAGALIGATSGAIQGFTNGLYASKGNFGQALGEAGWGALFGGVIGGAVTGVVSLARGNNFFTGLPKGIKPSWNFKDAINPFSKQVKGNNVFDDAVKKKYFAEVDADELAKMNPSWGDKLHRHHIFPRELADKFRAKGIEVDDFIVKVGNKFHNKVLHAGKGFGKGGRWNSLWRELVEDKQLWRNLSKEQIFNKAQEFQKMFNIDAIPYTKF